MKRDYIFINNIIKTDSLKIIVLLCITTKIMCLFINDWLFYKTVILICENYVKQYSLHRKPWELKRIIYRQF